MKERTNAAEIQQEDQEITPEKKVNYWKYAKPALLLAIGFIGGMAYAKSQKPTTFSKKNQGKTWNNNQSQKPVLKQKPVGDVNEVK